MMNAIVLSGPPLRRSLFAALVGMHMCCAGIDVFVYWRSPLVQIAFACVALFNALRPPLSAFDD